jgi:deoxyadenosine/deoxycytidine kinase
VHGWPYVVVTGPIGVGKSTVTRELAAAFDVPAFLERPDENPFISDFYESATRWAFASQMWFLADALDRQRRATARGGVQEHSAYEAAAVFGCVLREEHHLTEGEAVLLTTVCALGTRTLPAPDLVVLLTAPVDELMARIKRRNRPYEQAIDASYLERLVRARDAFFAAWTLCPVVNIDTTELDARLVAGRHAIAERVRDELRSLPTERPDGSAPFMPVCAPDWTACVPSARPGTVR